MRKCYTPEDGQSLCPHQGSGLFFICSLCFQHRNQLSGNKGECYKYGGQDNSRNCENNLKVHRLEQRIQDALPAECQNVNQSGDNGRNRYWHINQCGQQLFAPEAEFCHRPGRKQAENRIHRHSTHSRFQRQEHGAHRIFIGHCCKVGFPSLSQCLGRNRNQRQQQQHAQEQNTYTN